MKSRIFLLKSELSQPLRGVNCGFRNVGNDKIKQSVLVFFDDMCQKRWENENMCITAGSFLPNIDKTRFNHVKGETVLNLQLIMAHLNKLNNN